MIYYSTGKILVKDLTYEQFEDFALADYSETVPNSSYSDHYGINIGHQEAGNAFMPHLIMELKALRDPERGQMIGKIQEFVEEIDSEEIPTQLTTKFQAFVSQLQDIKKGKT